MAYADKSTVLHEPPKPTISAEVFKLCYEERVLAEARLLALDRWILERDKSAASRAAAAHASKQAAEAKRAAEAAKADALQGEKTARRVAREARAAKKHELFEMKQQRALQALKAARLQEYNAAKAAQQQARAEAAAELATKRTALEEQAAVHRNEEQTLMQQLLQLEGTLEGMNNEKHSLIVKLKQAIRREEEAKTQAPLVTAASGALPAAFRSPPRPLGPFPDAHRLIPHGATPPEHPTGPPRSTAGTVELGTSPASMPSLALQGPGPPATLPGELSASVHPSMFAGPSAPTVPPCDAAPISQQASEVAEPTQQARASPVHDAVAPQGCSAGPKYMGSALQGTPSRPGQGGGMAGSPASIEDGEVLPAGGGTGAFTGGGLAALQSSAVVQYTAPPFKKPKHGSTPEPGEIKDESDKLAGSGGKSTSAAEVDRTAYNRRQRWWSNDQATPQDPIKQQKAQGLPPHLR